MARVPHRIARITGGHDELRGEDPPRFEQSRLAPTSTAQTALDNRGWIECRIRPGVGLSVTPLANAGNLNEPPMSLP
jgi:hypothetical protein